MDTSFIISIFQNLASQLADLLPSLVTILIFLLLGWGVARFLAGIVRKFVIRAKLDRVFEDATISEELNKILPSSTLSTLSFSVTFWIVWIYIAISVITFSGLNFEPSPLANILSFLPHVFASFLILVGGALLAQFIGHWVQIGVATAGVEYHKSLGKGARLLLMVIASITAIEELGVDLSPLTGALTNSITIFIGGIALAFGMGARETVRNILAGYYAREHFSLGDQIEIEGWTGILNAIGTINSEVTLDEGNLIIPNKNLTETVVKIH